MNLAEHIAAHRLDTSCGWRAGTPGLHFRAWCACGWSSDPVPTDEVEIGVDSPTGLAAHAAHAAAAWTEHRTVRTMPEYLELPDGTWVRDRRGVIAQMPNEVYLPMTIVYHPEEDQ